MGTGRGAPLLRTIMRMTCNYVTRVLISAFVPAYPPRSIVQPAAPLSGPIA